MVHVHSTSSAALVSLAIQPTMSRLTFPKTLSRFCSVQVANVSAHILLTYHLPYVRTCGYSTDPCTAEVFVDLTSMCTLINIHSISSDGSWSHYLTVTSSFHSQPTPNLVSLSFRWLKRASST